MRRMHEIAVRTAVTVATVFTPLSSYAAEDQAAKIREFDIATIERLGQEIYAQDQLAWKATDIMIAKRTSAGATQDGVRGWITESADGKDVVRFIKLGSQGPESLYDVTIAAGTEPQFSTPDSHDLTAEEVAQYNARTLALKNISQPCSDHYNTVALKDPESDGWLVWALASTTTDADAILIGGHYRFTIAADGKSIIQKDALSKSCMKFSRKDMAKVPSKDAMPAGLVMTHIVSLTPIETFVFASLSYKEVLRVGTNDGKAWKIDNGRVTTVDQDAPGMDGFSARNFMAMSEVCATMVSNLNATPKDPHLVNAGKIKVISATEGTKPFSVAVEPGMHADGILCGRMDIVPAPNDYKVLQAGMWLMIRDQGVGHPDRMGTLVIVNGQLQFTLFRGDPLTDELEARVQARLDASQTAMQSKN